jgi:hypothetical protein
MAAVPENIKRRVEVFASGVNQIVCQFYRLSEKEIKIVEGK